MDLSLKQDLHELLEKLTHSGAPSLDQGLMKRVKTICRKSDSHVRVVYQLVMKDLGKKHAQVRLSAFQVLNELFNRSSLFRQLVLSDFKKFASLVTGTDPAFPLPPPKDAAAQLKRKGVVAIREWNQKFGSGYPELKLGFNYLKFNRKVDFERLVVDDEVQRRRREERETRQMTILQQRIQEVKHEMEVLKGDINSCLTEMESCFNLLLPRFDQPDIYKSHDSTVDLHGGRCVVEHHGDCPPAKKQRRTTTSSSCSFVSLDEAEDSECEVEEEAKGMRSWGEDGEESKMAKEGEGDIKRDGEGEEADIGSFRVVLDNEYLLKERSDISDLPKGSCDLPKGSCDLPKGNCDLPKGNCYLPKGSSDLPKGSCDLPKGNWGLPKGSSDLPKGSCDLPKGNWDQPKGSYDLLNEGSDLPKGSYDLLNEGSDLPKGSYDLLNEGSDLPKGSCDLPKGSSDLPKGSYDLPNEGSDLPKGSCDLPQGTSPLGGHCAESSSESDSDLEWEYVAPVTTSSEAGIDAGGVVMQEHGLALRGLVVPIKLGPRVEVQETEDNTSILSSLRENRQLLLAHLLPTLNRCLVWMTKAGEETCVRTAIDMKSHIHSALAKYNKLNITFTQPFHNTEHPTLTSQVKIDSSSIPETNLEWQFGSNTQESESTVEMELDPTTPQAQLAILKRRKKRLGEFSSLPSQSGSSGMPSSSSCSSVEKTIADSCTDLRTRAPVVPFDMDLYHWDQPSSVEPRTLATVGSLHRYWAEEKEVTISEDEQNRLKCRTISFPGQFQPVMKSCRALLPSRKLCPRKDRYKCPFHGVIIPRDEHGNPVALERPEGEGDSERGCASSDKPLWQDEELQEEIMAAKDIDLHVPKDRKRKAGKRKAGPKFPGLDDLSLLTDSPRQRLERKLLSKRSLRRVADDVDKLATKKFDDKFGNNFNYALNK